MKAALLMLVLVSVVASAHHRIGLDIPLEYKEVQPGEDLLVSISLSRTECCVANDTMLDYWIEDAAGKRYSYRRETLAVQTQASIVRSVHVPTNSVPGNFYLHARLTDFDGSVSDAQTSFTVITKARKEFTKYVLAAIVLGFLALMPRYLSGPFKRFVLWMRIRKIVRGRLR